MIPVLAWPAAALVGLSLGLLGAGGSILTVPLLHELVGLPMPLAVATSLPVVGSRSGDGWIGRFACLRYASRIRKISLPSGFAASQSAKVAVRDSR